MKKTSYNKLVRDRIPEIIEGSGRKAVYETLDDENFIKRLNEKLVEEVNEYLQSGSLEELADIGEVMHGILEYKGISIEAFQKARMEKLEQRGSFKKRLLLQEIIEQ